MMSKACNERERHFDRQVRQSLIRDKKTKTYFMIFFQFLPEDLFFR